MITSLFKMNSYFHWPSLCVYVGGLDAKTQEFCFVHGTCFPLPLPIFCQPHARLDYLRLAEILSYVKVRKLHNITINDNSVIFIFLIYLEAPHNLRTVQCGLSSSWPGSKAGSAMVSTWNMEDHQGTVGLATWRKAMANYLGS